MTALEIGRNCNGEEGAKLYFFTIIADILFGYCVFHVRRVRKAMLEPDLGGKHAMKHKNDLV
jgi:hypothetical protein